MPLSSLLLQRVGEEAVKTAPKGYAKDHPNIDLLRHKQHIFMVRYTEEMLPPQTF